MHALSNFRIMIKQMIISAGISLGLQVPGLAQNPDSAAMHTTASAFMRSGDFPNAILVLKKALQQYPASTAFGTELAFAYYQQRSFKEARDLVRELADRRDAGVPLFQIAGNIYQALGEMKEGEKLYRQALKRFPDKGVLYCEYGELLGGQNKTDDALEQWEAGIEADPNQAGNYYHAANYYYLKKNWVWALLYGEIFVNLESLSNRTVEMKGLLLDSYKNLYLSGDLFRNADKKNMFSQAVLTGLNNQAGITSRGITPEALTMIRTRFILEWYGSGQPRFPYRLFEYHQQMLKSGYFDAYNQWIFGTAANLAAYENWTKTHSAEHQAFTSFQRNRVFKLPARQYYQGSR